MVLDARSSGAIAIPNVCQPDDIFGRQFGQIGGNVYGSDRRYGRGGFGETLVQSGPRLRNETRAGPSGDFPDCGIGADHPPV